MSEVEVEPADDELLSALRAPPAKPELPEFKDWQGKEQRDALLQYFLFVYMALKKPVRRGRAGMPSIQACSLYRIYTDWHTRAFDTTPMNPRQFCLALNRAGVKRKRIYRQDEQHWLLMFCSEGSKRLIQWLEDNPDPFGYPATFTQQIGPTRQNEPRREQTPSPYKATGKAAGNVPPDADRGP